MRVRRRVKGWSRASIVVRAIKEQERYIMARRRPRRIRRDRDAANFVRCLRIVEGGSDRLR